MCSTKNCTQTFELREQCWVAFLPFKSQLNTIFEQHLKYKVKTKRNSKLMMVSGENTNASEDRPLRLTNGHTTQEHYLGRK